MTTRIHRRTCSLCEAMCGITVTLTDDRVTAIRGDDEDPFSRGHVCPKALALQDVWEDPDRLRHPLVRRDGQFVEVEWEEALEVAADGIRRVQAEHGNEAMGIYLGNPNAHNLGPLLVGSLLIKALRTPNRFSATSVDQLPHQFVQYHLYGHQLLFPVPDIERTDLLVVFGANPLQSNGSLMSAGGFKDRLREMQARGGRMVVVDPRRTRTAEAADQYLPIRPNHDVAILLGLLHVVFAEDLVAPGRLEPHVDGLTDVAALVADWTPERVAARCGWTPDQVRDLARDIATTQRAVVYCRVGTSTQRFATLATWLVQVLNVVTGNLDEPGGAMFTTPAMDVVTPRRSGGPARWHSRVRHLPEFGGELPVAVLGEEMLTPGPGQIRGMVTVAGNPVLSTPNGRQLDQGFAELDWHVAIDIYRNETTRHADVILPPTTGLEVSHYDVTFNLLAVRNVAKWSDPTVEVGDDRRHEHEIIRGLAQRLATPERPWDDSNPLTTAPLEAIVAAGVAAGSHDVTMEDLRAHPEGIDLGPLESRLPERLFTPDGRIDLVPAAIVGDMPRMRQWWEAGTGGDGSSNDPSTPLALIGRRHLRDNNSWLHNSARLVRGQDRTALLIHPDDARTRGVADGATVTVASRVGEVDVVACVDDALMPGVVSLPHGYGHGREGVQLAVAREHAGVSINDLTDDQLVDVPTGNAAFNGVEVTVRPRS